MHEFVIEIKKNNQKRHTQTNQDDEKIDVFLDSHLLYMTFSIIHFITYSCLCFALVLCTIFTHVNQISQFQSTVNSFIYFPMLSMYNHFKTIYSCEDTIEYTIRTNWQYI